MTVHVPRAVRLSRREVLALREDEAVSDVQVKRGRVTDTLVVDVVENLEPEAEGRVRARAAALIESGRGDALADLTRRVDELEQIVRNLRGGTS